MEGQPRGTPAKPRDASGALGAVLLAAGNRKTFPVIVGLMAVVSAATGLYPFLPVLIAAVAIAPSRWRAIYLASVLGAATGAGLLASAIQLLGNELLARGFVRVGTLPHWLEAGQLVRSYGDYALAMVAALPVPQMPVLIVLALAKTSPWAVAAAVLVGKLAKYGVYIFGTELLFKAVRRGLRKD